MMYTYKDGFERGAVCGRDHGYKTALRNVLIGAAWSRDLTADWDRYQAMAYVIDDALEALAALGDEEARAIERTKRERWRGRDPWDGGL